MRTLRENVRRYFLTKYQNAGRIPEKAYSKGWLARVAQFCTEELNLTTLTDQICVLYFVKSAIASKIKGPDYHQLNKKTCRIQDAYGIYEHLSVDPADRETLYLTFYGALNKPTESNRRLFFNNPLIIKLWGKFMQLGSTEDLLSDCRLKNIPNNSPRLFKALSEIAFYQNLSKPNDLE